MIHYVEDMLELAMVGNAQGVFFFMVLYAFIFLTYSFFYQLRVSGWPSVIGDLDEASIEIWGARERQKSDQMFKAKAGYRYIVNGMEFIGTRISPWFLLASSNAKFLLKYQLNSVKSLSNGKVEVYYNPKKPSKSFLIKPGAVGFSITLIFAFFPVVVYAIKYHT